MTNEIRRAVRIGAIVVGVLGVAHVVDRAFHAPQPGSTVELRQPDAIAPSDDQERQQREGPPSAPYLVKATPTGVNTQPAPSGEHVWVRESDGSVWALRIPGPTGRAAVPQTEPVPGDPAALVFVVLATAVLIGGATGTAWEPTPWRAVQAAA